MLTVCAVLIVDTSSGPSTSTVKWTRTRHTSRWPATTSTISSHQSIANITSATDPNDFRPSAATSIRVTTSIPDSPDFRGQPPRRVASRARPSTSGRRDCSRLSGAGTDSLVCAARRTIASVPSINIPRRASTNARMTSTKTPSSPC